MAWLLRFLFAVAAVPLACGLTLAFVDVLRNLPAPDGAVVAPGVLAVLAGMVAQLLLGLLLPIPSGVYVLGHELTHAMCGLFFGARVSNLRVAATGGSVTLSKSNVWITLAPYVFPFYTVLVGLVALVTRGFVSPLPWPCAWLFAVGFTWGFHCFFTVRSLLQEQPDIEEYGRVFSYVFIWAFNVVGVATWIVCTSGIPWSCFGRSLLSRTCASYGTVWSFLVWGYESLRALPVLQG